MDFEEFFTKKRIDMDALQKVEPSLFSEFKTQYAQMGEKSFDYTKKYWFNKLRLQFPLAVEPKTEKVKIANPLAEQTITESLIEETVTPPKLGFVPKFKATNIQKPAADTAAETKPAEQSAATPAPKLGFTPKFKAASPPKPAAPAEETVASEPAPKLGFTPKFKAANSPKAAATTEENKAEETPALAPKLGFTPKFKAANPPKPAAEQTEPAKAEETLSPTPASKLGFTPKFKAANPPKPAAEATKSADTEATEDTPTAENTEAKPAYKPRFNMKNLPKKEE